MSVEKGKTALKKMREESELERSDTYALRAIAEFLEELIDSGSDEIVSAINSLGQ